MTWPWTYVSLRAIEEIKIWSIIVRLFRPPWLVGFDCYAELDEYRTRRKLPPAGREKNVIWFLGTPQGTHHCFVYRSRLGEFLHLFIGDHHITCKHDYLGAYRSSIHPQATSLNPAFEMLILQNDVWVSPRISNVLRSFVKGYHRIPNLPSAMPSQPS